MDYFIFLITIIIVLAFIIKAKEFFDGNSSEEKTETTLPYHKTKYLLSIAEKNFFKVLENILDDKYYIFPKIRMSDLLWHSNRSRDFRYYHNKIQQKHIDFVVCDKNNISPLLAIELDDSSHNYQRAKKNDKLKNEAFKMAGIPLLRVWVRKEYDKDWLTRELENLNIKLTSIK